MRSPAVLKRGGAEPLAGFGVLKQNSGDGIAGHEWDQRPKSANKSCTVISISRVKAGDGGFFVAWAGCPCHVRLSYLLLRNCFAGDGHLPDHTFQYEMFQRAQCDYIAHSSPSSISFPGVGLPVARSQPMTP